MTKYRNVLAVFSFYKKAHTELEWLLSDPDQQLLHYVAVKGQLLQVASSGVHLSRIGSYCSHRASINHYYDWLVVLLYLMI